MAARKWNQVPGAQWWGNPSDPRSSVISKFPETVAEPPLPRLLSRTRNLTRNYYDFAEEVQNEDELKIWLKGGSNRGALRVYEPGSTYSELIKCTANTSAEVVMTKCVATELYVNYAGHSIEPLTTDCKPLQIQENFLRSLGYVDSSTIQLEGINENLSHMFKFVAGKEDNKADDRVQLACTVRIKEIGPFGFWSKRFCVLCGPKLYIFSSSQPKGKPSSILDLARGVITEQVDKKHLYCIQISTVKKIILLSFETRYEQSIWLKRAAKVVMMHPLEANLSRCSLDQIPKYLFLNKDLAALNLSHNYMFEGSKDSPEDIGFINDLHMFNRLRILSLSDNNLSHFPVSVCNIVTISELDLSCNRIAIIPKEIQRLKCLTTLLLHSNLLSNLPYHLNELHKLTTLVIAFNRFKSIPHIVKELQCLRILIAAGNRISAIPEDIHRIQTLQVLDLRLNQITTELPSTTPDLISFFSLNIHGNNLTDFDMRRAKYLHVVNLSDNSLRSLNLHKGMLRMLNARNNCLTKLMIPSIPIGLSSLDLSRNQLALLPESLSQLVNLEKLIVSNNKLTSLPRNIFKTLPKLQILHVNNNSLYNLPVIGERCPLQSLDIRCNKIKELPENLFTKFERLEQLNISSNPISSLPSVKKKRDQQQQIIIPNLTDLRAANCSLTPNAMNSIMSLRKLKVLHLAYNSIKKVPPEVFTALRELEYLSLAGNKISILLSPPHSCPRLVCLILHSNNLIELPQFPTMPSLETLDISSNDLLKIPHLEKFTHLKSIDLSNNPNLQVNSQNLQIIKYLKCIRASGIPQQTLDLLKDHNSNVEAENLQIADKWAHASADARGTNLPKSGDFCIQKVNLPVFQYAEKDAIFAMIDGGKAPDASDKIKSNLSDIIKQQISTSHETDVHNPMMYIEQSFLVAHRELGQIGLKYGASMVLCHLKEESNREFTLNTANTGLGEAILCSGNQVTVLTNPHNPATNKEESNRVAQEKGFISEDDRVNGICGVSRLLGCYYLHPQIIPLPSTKSITLPPSTSFLIIGTHGLWKYLSQKEIIRCIHSLRSPSDCSKWLAAVAIANGCPLDVSVTIVKIDLSEGFENSRSRITALDQDMRNSVATTIQEEDEEEEEDNEITNIDDLIEEAFIETGSQSNDTSVLESEGLRVISPELLDALVMNATDVDDFTMINETQGDEEDLIREGSFVYDDEEIEEEQSVLHSSRRDSTYSGNQDAYIVNVKENLQGKEEEKEKEEEVEEDEGILNESNSEHYLAETFPRDHFATKQFSLHTSFEETQSVPVISEKYEAQLRQINGVDPALDDLNVTISHISKVDEEDDEDPHPKPNVKRKQSFVQTSYARLSRHAMDSGTSFHSV